MRAKLLVPTATFLTLLCGSQVSASPVIVACGRGQHTVIRDTYVRGEPATRVACVGDSYRAARPIRYDERRYDRRRQRSWGKSALIIGGSAGTGAGIGGIVGGRKGALIGAALGGGAGSLFEGAHRR
jgi:hypothetical protein